jgi:hypothetical protein
MLHLPTEVIAAIADSSPHRSRMLALSCSALKQHRSAAVFEALTRKTAQLESLIKELAREATQITQDLQIDHANWIIDTLIDTMCHLREPLAPPPSKLTVFRGTSVSRIWQQAPTGSRDHLMCFTLHPHSMSTDGSLWVHASCDFFLGRRMMKHSHEYADRSTIAIRINTSAAIPTSGEIEIEGLDGVHIAPVRVRMGYRDKRVLETLRTMGFY